MHDVQGHHPSILTQKLLVAQKPKMSSDNTTSNITKQKDQTCCCKRTDHVATFAQTQSVTNTFPVWGVDTASSLLSGLPKPLPNYSDDSPLNDVAQIERMKEALTCFGLTKAASGSDNTNKSNISISSNFCKAGPSVADHSNKELPDEYVPCRTVYIINSAQPPTPNTGKRTE